ncbi:uncharacterized protein LOC143542542 [Bidens hawaiensis]|uniref:uncharacterized protein LOC143542542 n=1 Tax=Bidens hawaiensis TaxID=980011 RepID=UPI004049E6B5
MSSRHIPLFFFFFFFFHHAYSQLPPSQITTMNNLQKLIPKWNSNSSLNLANPCSWTGVTCNNSSITELSFSSFALSDSSWSSFSLSDSSWSSLVCQIETLQLLDLSYNKLTSIAPPLLSSSCGSLKVSNFSNNYITGSLPTFQTSLERLDLSHNSFQGTIPEQYTQLRALTVLDLSYNRLTGPIPDAIGQLSKLQQLVLSANTLSGSIPSGIGQLSGLQQLILSSNNLTGEIPQSLARITTLKRFSANYNGFTGSAPLGITDYLSNLDLSYNNLNGPLPSDLLSHPNLVTLDLSVNNLEGSIPSNVSKSLVRLRLGNNRLTGQIPVWSFATDVPSLAYLEVGCNGLTGMIPSELRLCKNLSLLDLSHNKLTGNIPHELGGLNKLQGLQLDHNNLTGEIPSEFGELRILVKLNMSSNSLSGSIPPSLSNLQKLLNLDLQANNLSGQIPDSFGDLGSLLELQLGSNQLSGVIRNLPIKLQIALNLSRNNFNGPIPESISRIQSLEILDLSNNQFSGIIPSFLTGMRSLTQILLSNNQLSGSVPQISTNVIFSYEGNINLSNTTSNLSPDQKKDNTVSMAIVAASIAAVVALMILIVVAVIVSRKIHRVDDDESQPPPPLQVIKTQLLTLNVIHRTNIDFDKVMECMGQLSSLVVKTRFSTYYKAVMPSGMTYFVKRVDPSAKIFQLGRHDLLENELETIGRLRNSNVLVPLAYTLTVDSAYLLYEFSEKGTLFDVLQGSLGSCLDWTNRYSIALGVANGLAYLHGLPTGPILLLDLSSKAVMLKSLNEPRIGDIELYKVIDPSKSTGNLSDVAGSVGYVPPEYAYTMRVTMAGNVYSFGVILLELLTGKTAISEGSELAKWVSTKSKEKRNIDQILDSTVRWTSPAVKDQMLAVLKVALACVSDSPESRPDMRSVIHMLLNTRN